MGQNIVKKRLIGSLDLNAKAPAGGRGFLLLSISSIAVWVKLKCQFDLLLFQVFKQFWGLTRVFWAENDKRKIISPITKTESVSYLF
jgi:hypothetical protein